MAKLAVLRYSKLANNDLREIAKYTRVTWGQNQAQRYIGDLRAACLFLARHPFLGSSDDIRPDIRRKLEGSQFIFYRVTPSGVTVTRILHNCQSPGPHLSVDE